MVLREGQSATAQDIADWCRKHLTAIKVPRYVTFVASLPHTPTHRVEKFKMRQDKMLRERAVDLSADRLNYSTFPFPYSLDTP